LLKGLGRDSTCGLRWESSAERFSAFARTGLKHEKGKRTTEKKQKKRNKKNTAPKREIIDRRYWRSLLGTGVYSHCRFPLIPPLHICFVSISVSRKRIV
jgi:hypothetical protein